MRPASRSLLAVLLIVPFIAGLSALALLATGAPSAHGQQVAEVAILGKRTAFSPGGLVTYTFTVSNTGSTDETVAFSQSDGWTAHLPEPVDVSAGAEAQVEIHVEVPLTAEDRAIEPIDLEWSLSGGEPEPLPLVAWLGGRAWVGRYVGCRYDLDYDGEIDVDDVDLVTALIGSQEGDESYDPQYDFDHSGAIDRDDEKAALDALQTRSTCAPLVGAEVDSTKLVDAVSVENLRFHLESLYEIATENEGTRAAGGPGYQASVDYVRTQLEAVGYEVSVQEFTYDSSVPTLEACVAAICLAFEQQDIRPFTGSATGRVTGTLQTVDLVLPPSEEPSSTSGCEPEDFEDFVPGHVAMVQRGECPFQQKAENAVAAGAVGMFIFNEGQENRQGPVGARLRNISIPVVGASFEVAQSVLALRDNFPDEDVKVTVGLEDIEIPTYNVLADTPGGRDDRVVVVGGHLDSVPAGAGINDNGSGSAAILETAIQFSLLGLEPKNKLRFAFWGAEERGLLGSRHYVSQLTQEERDTIMLNLNYDMIGSPNFIRAVYDGDGLDDEGRPLGPAGSGDIEQVYNRYFESEGLAHEPTGFDGRSDYGPFIAVDIPAGGLFTGAEARKSEVQAGRYGGTAGEALDPCYHQPCDTIENVNWDVLEEMAGAAAHTALVMAMDEYIPVINGRLGRDGLDTTPPPPPVWYSYIPWLTQGE